MLKDIRNFFRAPDHVFDKLRAMFWKRSIHTRVIIIALTPSLLIFGLMAVQLLRQTLAESEQVTLTKLSSSARHLSAASQYALISGNLFMLQAAVENEISQSQLLFACIKDNNEALRVCSAQAGKFRLTNLPRQGDIVKLPNAWITTYPITLPEIDPDNEAEPSFRIIGYAISAVDTKPLETARRNALFTFAVLAIITIWLTTLLASRLAGLLTRRIQSMSKAVERIASGKLDVRVETHPSTELATLEAGINHMAGSLQTHQDELQLRIDQATADLAAKKEEAERSNATRTRFFAAASHDLRQPLHALGLFSEALRQKVTSPELVKLANMISGSISSLESLLNALLDVSRLDAGAIEARRRHFPCNQLFDHIQQQYEAAAANKGLKLKVRYSNQVIYSDPVLLERILTNLVSNALRYTINGSILISGRKRKDTLLIQVWDTGIGIPQEALDSIFQEFIQLNNPENDREKGLGLGLAIVARTVKLLDINISVRSSLDHGSVFSLEVPLGSAKQVQSPEMASLIIANSLQGMLAVVVDDEAIILRAVESLFKTWDIDTITGLSAQEAMNNLGAQTREPDFLITDYNLPDNTDGLDVAELFRNKFGPDFPVLVLTGDTTPASIKRINDAGFHIMHKPVRPARLRSAIAHLMESTPAGKKPV